MNKLMIQTHYITMKKLTKEKNNNNNSIATSHTSTTINKNKKKNCLYGGDVHNIDNNIEIN